MINTLLRTWLTGVLLAAGTVLLFVGGPEYYPSRSFGHGWDLGHIVYFALFTSLLIRWRFIARLPLAGQWAVVLLITLLAGVSIEFLQQDTGRTLEIGDVLRDLIGSLIVLVFGSPGAGLRPVGLRHFLRVAVLMLALVQLWPVTRSLIDEAVARQQFPLLSGFETPFEIDRWTGIAGLSVVAMPAISPGKLLRLSLTTDHFSGAALKYFDGDWTAAGHLNISLYNPDASPLRITCRIHDLQHADGHEEYEDRFNRSFRLQQGWNHIEIDLQDVAVSPARRRMDMRRIRGIGLFASALPAPRIIYLDDVRLSP